ncbi:hypothetical protein C8D89_103333 [Actinomycetospora cinnamomea]|uniref:Uncharacterized protein n=1 Tax=Actinomycetospora cinnamomea TaxID=663609 RepID=A0A2U1FII8_9PSEU|nr:hypothetical protein C8D89_103333 [Actinomycetospora cinnamomea]
MAFVHGHARETGWVVSHYRRPQRAGDDQLDLIDPVLPRPRRREDGSEDGDDQVCDSSPDDPDEPACVRSIPRRTASTR